MRIEVADELLSQSGLTRDELLLEIAIAFYRRGKLSMGKASQLAKVHQVVFQRELGARGIPVNLTWEDVSRDLQNLEELRQRL